MDHAGGAGELAHRLRVPKEGSQREDQFWIELLPEVDANERSISHRFGMYLQMEFPIYHVDCEYNRDEVDPKRIGHLNLHPDAEDTVGQTVFPDIIVHVA
ncbi:MAG: hypothetical protein ACREX4_21110 [Gammaproteobacteria bacterium]